MKVFTSEELQRQPAEVQQSALVEPTYITFHGKPRLVIMSVDEFDRLRNRRRTAMNVADIPEDLTAELEAIASKHPVAEGDLGLLGGLLDGSSSQSTNPKIR